MPESFESLRQKLLELAASARATTPEHRESFWAHRPLENFPPQTIRFPEEYDGAEEVAIACTQTDLGAKAQRELVDRWCREIGSLPVRWVWLQTKAPQGLFEAACSIRSLEGLCVSWGTIDDLTPLRMPPDLRFLRLGSCPSVPSFDVFSGLTQLRWLEVELPRAVSDLEWVRTLHGLEGLSVVGQEGKGRTVSSLSPLSKLTELRWLHFGALGTDDSSLRPLASLQALRYLSIGNKFPMPEFARLSKQLPLVDCDWFSPGHLVGWATCKRCKQSGKLMISGKGVTSLCPRCDAEKWEKIVDDFIIARESP